ncbi:MAG: CopD family protein [Aestuariivita sp.]|nr:CopD family protein [Aestuariivita sp.]
MTNFLSDIYPWTKAIHIIAMIAWMAGLFYLPRLYVYHVEKGDQINSLPPLFEIMERRLLRVIMMPAMIVTWVFGLVLLFTPGIVNWNLIWPWTKIIGVVGLTWFHHWLAKRRKDFLAKENKISGRTFRLMNEIPTIMLILIVFSVVLKF